MTKGQRTIATLLGAMCVLLVLNLVKGKPEAQAQKGPPFDSGAPTVVAGHALRESGHVDRIWRWWSDGTVDVSSRDFSPFSGCVFGTNLCGPEVVIDLGF